MRRVFTEDQKLRRKLYARAYYQKVRKHDPVFKEKNKVTTKAARAKRLSTPEGLASFKRWRQDWTKEQREKLRALKEVKAGRPRPENCEVCGQPCRSSRVLAFDHCHETGVFRGWLCTSCNTAIGLVKDNPSLLRALADYIERSVKKS